MADKITVRFKIGEPLEEDCKALLWPEDTMQVMSPLLGIREPSLDSATDELGNLVRRALSSEPIPLGSMMVENHPFIQDALFARLVVFNLSAEPTAGPRRIEESLFDALLWLSNAGISNVATPTLGAGFGGISMREWGKILGEVSMKLWNADMKTPIILKVVIKDERDLVDVRLGYGAAVKQNNQRLV